MKGRERERENDRGEIKEKEKWMASGQVEKKVRLVGV